MVLGTFGPSEILLYLQGTLRCIMTLRDALGGRACASFMLTHAKCSMLTLTLRSPATAVCDGGPSWWSAAGDRFLSTSTPAAAAAASSSAAPPIGVAAAGGMVAAVAGGGGGGGGVLLAGEVALAMPMLGVSQRLLNKDHHKVRCFFQWCMIRKSETLVLMLTTTVFASYLCWGFL